MSAAELLKHARGLPRGERQKLLSGLLTLEEQPERTVDVKKRVKWPDVEARARRIFGKKVMPNLVLMEREEASA